MVVDPSNVLAPCPACRQEVSVSGKARSLRCDCGQASNFIVCRKCGAPNQQLQANFGAPVTCPRCAEVDGSPKSITAWDWVKPRQPVGEGSRVAVACPACQTTVVVLGRDRSLKCSCGVTSNFVQCRKCRWTNQQLQAQYGAPIQCLRCADVEASPKSATAWDWATNHGASQEAQDGIGPVDSVRELEPSQVSVPRITAFRGRVLGLQQTEKGADALFGESTVDDVSTLIANFFAAGGFTREAGTPERSTWAKGHAGARAVAGGFVSRAKYLVVISQVPDGVQLSVVSTMSGWSGSLVGVAREHVQRKEFFDRLQSHLSALSVQSAPPPPSAAPGDDPVSALERLRELRNRDLISEEEFHAKRSEIIDRL